MDSETGRLKIDPQTGFKYIEANGVGTLEHAKTGTYFEKRAVLKQEGIDILRQDFTSEENAALFSSMLSLLIYMHDIERYQELTQSPKNKIYDERKKHKLDGDQELKTAIQKLSTIEELLFGESMLRDLYEPD